MNEHAFWKSCEETQFSSKYYLKTLLGVGGFGAVYRADEVVADRCIRTVALKIFNPFQTPNLDTFIQEFQTTANLRHPHLIETYALEEGKLQGAIDSLGLVMELAGEDLAKHLERSLLTVAETRSLVQQVAETLKFLHSKGIVHRDIKPHNIMAVGSGADLIWKVGDLGIVRVIGNKTATMTTNRQGSPFYVPPEAYSGEVSPAMDLWALGVTITQVLTGKVPFPGPSEAEVVNQVLYQEPALPQMEDTLAAIVRGCLVKDRKSRWTPSQILEALNLPKQAEEPILPVAGLRSEEYTLEIVENTDTAGLNGQRRTITVTRWIEDLGDGVLLYLVKIPAGSFMMGSPDGEVDRESNEGPQHQVNFPNDFWMGQFAVTKAQYKAVGGMHPSFSSENPLSWVAVTQGEYKIVMKKNSSADRKNPMTSLSWDDAMNFCQWLSQSTGRVYRLPTEAEWEYACRATTTTPFHFGESITPDLVNYNAHRTAVKGEYRKLATPVGNFPGNLWGLYDMHGNVAEWCLDQWHDNYNQKPKNLKQDGSIPWTETYNDISPLNNRIKILRGGSWGSIPKNCRAARRVNVDTKNRCITYVSIGLRVVCVTGTTKGSKVPPSLTLRSETYRFQTVVNTDATGYKGDQREVTVTRWIEDLGNGVVLHLVKIPAGSFMMGSLGGSRNTAWPKHQVDFPNDFWIGQFAVTQAQYQAVMKNNPSHFQGEQNPVEQVTWNDVVNFCQRLSQLTGRDYRLPTEAEWEYACRATTTTPFHFGESITPDLVNYNGNHTDSASAKGQYQKRTTPVGNFPGNLWGLYDMHGNVAEWCLDQWHKNYYQKPNNLKKNGSIPWISNPESLLSNLDGVLRGGSWDYDPKYCRSEQRVRDMLTDSNNFIGFRVVCTL